MSAEQLWDLPPSWSWERFEEVADVDLQLEDAKRFPTAVHIAPNHIESGTARLVDQGTVAGDKVAGPKHRFSRGQVLYSKIRPYLAKAVIAPCDGFCSSDMYPINARCEPAFLVRWLVSPAFTVRVSRDQNRTVLPKVNLATLRELPVPVPPLNEQRRIVAKLEALQARSRRAREALDAVPPLLEKLRQSILAAAFRGDLTKDWRAKHKDVEPASTWIRNNPQPEQRRSGRAAAITVRPGRCAISVGDPKTSTPPGWCWTSLLSVARMESGHTPSRAVESYWNGGIPWVSIPDARDHNGTTIDETASTISEEGLANSAARILPRETVCLVRTAASIGYVTVLGREMATSQDFANWVCGPALLPKYLMYALWAERDAIRSFGEGSAHPTVYFPELKAFHLKLAPLEEQQVIVDRIERYLSTWERLRGSVSAARQALATLESSYLAKAFRGELVPQDPRDEPAEAMLARLEGAKGAGQEAASRAKSASGRRREARG